MDGQPHDLFHQLLRVCGILRTVPDIEVTMDMVTANYAASAICCLSHQESSLGKAFHLVHPEPLSLRDFVALFPTPPTFVPPEEWLTQVRREAERSDDSSVHFLSMLAQGLERADIAPPTVDCSGTTASLRGTGVTCLPLDRQFVRELTGNSFGFNG